GVGATTRVRRADAGFEMPPSGRAVRASTVPSTAHSRVRVRSESALDADGVGLAVGCEALHWRHANEKQADGSGGGGGAVAVFNFPGPRRLRNAARRDRGACHWCPSPSRILCRQYAGLGLQGYGSEQHLLRPYNPRGCLVDALDDLRWQAAAPLRPPCLGVGRRQRRAL